MAEAHHRENDIVLPEDTPADIYSILLLYQGIAPLDKGKKNPLMMVSVNAID